LHKSLSLHAHVLPTLSSWHRALAIPSTLFGAQLRNWIPITECFTQKYASWSSSSVEFALIDWFAFFITAIASTVEEEVDDEEMEDEEDVEGEAEEDEDEVAELDDSVVVCEAFEEAVADVEAAEAFFVVGNTNPVEGLATAEDVETEATEDVCSNGDELVEAVEELDTAAVDDGGAPDAVEVVAAVVAVDGAEGEDGDGSAMRVTCLFFLALPVENISLYFVVVFPMLGSIDLIFCQSPAQSIVLVKGPTPTLHLRQSPPCM